MARFTAHLCNTVRSKQYEHESSIGDIRSLFRRIANEVYVIHKPEVIIYDTSEVMNSFIESLKLDSTERIIPVYDISFIQEYLF